MLSPVKLGQALDAVAVSAASVLPATSTLKRNVAGAEQQRLETFIVKAGPAFKEVVTNHSLH